MRSIQLLDWSINNVDKELKEILILGLEPMEVKIIF